MSLSLTKKSWEVERMMKERILQIMRKMNMTQQEFAKAIEVSPASMSNIFNGKTNPTNNHVSAIHRRFPEININWLMFGEGDMYATVAGETNGGVESISDESKKHSLGIIKEEPDLFSAIEEKVPPLPGISATSAANGDNEQNKEQVPVVREVIKYVDKPQRKITEIRIFFDDGTFEVFS